MQFLSTLFVLATAGFALASPTVTKRATVQGIDVSHYQGTVDWTTAKSNGVEFAYLKATEGLSYIDPTFSTNYANSGSAGVIRGAYHFANLYETGGGAAQAKYFLAHGGAWTNNSNTLPGALDLEKDPNHPECYGLTTAQVVQWVKDFSDTYHASTGVAPVIYTTTSWWTSCTGNSAAFGSTNPLWLARYASSVGTLPAGWTRETIWQYADSGSNPGDQDVFNGDMTGLRKLSLH